MQVGAALLTEDSRSFSRRPSVKIFPVAKTTAVAAISPTLDNNPCRRHTYG